MTPKRGGRARSTGALVALLLIGVSQNGLAAVLPAVVHWSHRVELAFPEAGVVKNVLVEAGQHVRAGQQLAVLDSTIYQARVEERSAEAARTKEEAAKVARDLACVLKTLQSSRNLDV